MEKASQLLRNGLAESTRTAYTAAWANYERYTSKHGHQAIPVTFPVLANWIAEQVEFNKPETVKQYTAALRNVHIEKGISIDVFNDPRISRIFRGALRIHGSKPVRKHVEITKDILLAAIATFDSTAFDDLNLHRAFCVAFAAFLRPSEFTWESWNPNTSPLTRVSQQSVEFTKDGVLLNLPKSKTDQYREGTTIPLSPASDSSCPVRALKTC